MWIVFLQRAPRSSNKASVTVTEGLLGVRLSTNQLDLIGDVKHLGSYANRPLALIVIGIFLALCAVVWVFAIVKANTNKDALMDLERHLFMDTGTLDYEAQLLMQCGMKPSHLTRGNFWSKVWHAFRTEHVVVRTYPLPLRYPHS